MSEEFKSKNESTTWSSANQESDKKLYAKARARASFKIHVILFILVNLLLWVFWYFVFKSKETTGADVAHVFAFITIIWLLILAGHYVFVYVFNATLVEKELKRLKNQISDNEKAIERLKIISDQRKAELQRKEVENESEKQNQNQ